MHNVDDSLWFGDMWQHLRNVDCSRADPDSMFYRNVSVIDGWGYPVKNGNSVIKPDSGFGWGHEHVDLINKNYDLKNINDLNLIPARSNGIDVLLSFPGAYTFGHWPIDILARIERSLALHSSSACRYIVPGPLPSWTKIYLDAYGIRDEQLVPISRGQRYDCDNILIPFLRSSDYLSSYPHANAFKCLRARGALVSKGHHGYGEKIFVKHKPQTSLGQRGTLRNWEEIEKMLVEQGFISISPGEMTIQEQIAAFSCAKVIVGEDSSALHNIIYSNNANLVVINSASRKNLLHLSICKILDHNCLYLVVEEDQDRQFFCDPLRLAGCLK